MNLKKCTQFYSLEKSKEEDLAPKEKGMNIEALAASRDGEKLYIGFRNPRPFKGEVNHALVAVLSNPAAVVDIGQTPAFDGPILFNFQGLGIRSMEYVQWLDKYLIVAGSHNGGDDFAFYSWTGVAGDDPKLVTPNVKFDNHEDFTPEAMVSFVREKRVLIISDDGSIEVSISGPYECMDPDDYKNGRCENKHLKDPAKRTFRAIWLK